MCFNCAAAAAVEVRGWSVWGTNQNQLGDIELLVQPQIHLSRITRLVITTAAAITGALDQTCGGLGFRYVYTANELPFA